MFRIFYDTLVKPKAIVNHVDSKSKGKFIGFVILLILLQIIPFFIAQVQVYSFTNQEAENVSYIMQKNESVEYSIKDGKLVYNGNGDPVVQSIKIDKDKLLLSTLPVYLVFSLDGTGYEVNDENGYIIIFQENSIDIKYRPYKKTDGATKLAGIYDAFLYPTEESQLHNISYGDLNVDLNYANGYKNNFYLEVFKVGSVIYNDLKWDFILQESFITIFSNVAAFFLNVLFTAVIMFLFFRYMGLRFKTIFKISILCSTIYVVGYVLAFLYNFTLLSYILEFVAMIYTYRTMKQYAILKMTNQHGGE